ncbi:MAG: hypothetical protein LUG98_01025, partial [Tannerellaceae bacterium]|nr:hypothetical protein [Tannerellaceae bacterium]
NLYHYNNKLFFTVEDKSMKYCLYDLSNEKFVMSDNFAIGVPNIRTEFFQGEDDSILFVLTPEQIEEFIEDKTIPIKNETLIDLSQELQIDDNPVIVIAKVRS